MKKLLICLLALLLAAVPALGEGTATLARWKVPALAAPRKR